MGRICLCLRKNPMGALAGQFFEIWSNMPHSPLSSGLTGSLWEACIMRCTENERWIFSGT